MVSKHHTDPPSTLKPALSPEVQIGLTIAYTVIYSLLFLVVYIQLWMILYYKHRRFSYQTVFLFLCLIWSGLRTTLFSFYYNNCYLANELTIVPYWFLYCCPVCIQFMTLCLLVLFFAQVVFKSRAKYEPNKYKNPLRIVVGIAVLIFVGINIATAIYTRVLHKDETDANFTLIRVVVDDSLFLVFAIFLSICIYKMTKISSANLVLEAKGTTVRQAVVACVFIIFLFTSRAVYNIVAISCQDEACIPGFGYDWINVSDQADFVTLENGFNYLSFGIVLFVWEILPTFVVVVFFRVRRPSSAVNLAEVSSGSFNSKAYFFDNPRRYDSDDDLTRYGTPRGSTHDFSASINSSGPYGYGSFASRSGSLPKSAPRGSFPGHIPGTPPINFHTGHSHGVQVHQHSYDGT